MPEEDPILTAEIIDEGMSYREYRDFIKKKLKEGVTTGGDSSEDLVNYTRLNVQRMRRLDKTVTLGRELKKKLERLTRPWYWVVLTEGWCGDAAQNIPVIAKMAEVTSKITLKLILRDEHPEIMSQYLTDGSRSIPKLICLDAQTLEELGTWGPRPEPAQKMVIDYKRDPDQMEYKKKLHKWYAKDQGITLQEEFSNKLDEWASVEAVSQK